MFDLGVGEADAGAAAEGDDYDEDDHQAGKQEEGAVDFMDEDELIEDDLDGGLEDMMEAELEDYDEDEGDGEVRATTAATATTAPPAVAHPPRLKITRVNQAEEARKQGIMLPVLGMTAEGDALLDFSHLFRSTLVVADVGADEYVP